MYKPKQTLITLTFALALYGCEDGGRLLDPNSDFDPLIPETPVDDGSDAPRPPESAQVSTTDKHQIYTPAGNAVLARGINLQYGDDTFTRFDGIAGIATAGSNVIRIVLNADTAANELEVAMERAMSFGMGMILTLDDDNLRCRSDDSILDTMVQDLWFEEWLPIIAQERFQPYLMINLARQWGPRNIRDASSKSYSEYIDTHKLYIRQFRDAGFKVPLVVSAPGCGSDYRAFVGGRARELLASDEEKNLILSVDAYGGDWNSPQKITAATNALYNTNIPFILTEFGGSVYEGDTGVNHLDLMAKAAGDEALLINIPWIASGDKVAYKHTLATPASFVGATFEADIYLPESYVESEQTFIEFYVKDGSWNFASFGAIPLSSAQGDSWYHVSYNIETADDFQGWKAEGFDPSLIQEIGIQLTANGNIQALNGELKLDNIRVKLVEEEQASVFTATFDEDLEGWSNYTDWGSASGAPSVAEGQLSIDPEFYYVDDDDKNDMLVLGSQSVSAYNQIDMSKAFSIKADIWLPENTEAPGLWFKYHIQDGNWESAETDAVGIDTFTLGAWTTVELSIPESSYNEAFDRNTIPNLLVLMLGGVTQTPGGIKIDNIEIVGAAEGENVEVALDINFSDAEQSELFQFDFAEGSFSAENPPPSAAVTRGLGNVPFGWLAWSWIGNQGEDEKLNLSAIEGVQYDESDPDNQELWQLVLTERGDEIIQGDHGIWRSAVVQSESEPQDTQLE